MANKYTPRPQPPGKQSNAPRPHERRAAGAYPYYRVATFSPVSLTYRDNPKVYDTREEALASVVRKLGLYRLSIIHENGRIDTEDFKV